MCHMQNFDRNFDWTIKKVYKVKKSAEKQIDIPDQLHMAIYELLIGTE